MTRLTKTHTKGTWRIEGTDLAVRREQGGWALTVLTRDREPVRWLISQNLLLARAASRRDLLRAYEAATATCGAPPESVPVELKRLGPGFYTVPGAGITITRTPDKNWWVNILNPPARHLAWNLGAARELIRVRHHDLLTGRA